MIGKKILHYEVIDKLGEGGMGSVYLAEDTKLHRKVALKFLSSRIESNAIEVERFKNEARIAASLSHPHIAQVYAIEDAEEGSFIAMQYVKGFDLKEYLNTHELSIPEKEEIARKIAMGLHAAHSNKIIHRDIKAGNIMITGEGEVKILDFGLARLENSVHLTDPGHTKGTALYMAPELIMGKEADERSDIWAFGVVLYELFAQTMPFDGVYEQAISYAILDETPTSVREINDQIPENIEAVINRCLEKQPQDRYQSVDEILKDLNTESLSYQPRETMAGAIAWDWKKLATSRYLMGGILTSVLAGFLIFMSVYGVMQNDSGTKKLAIIPFNNIGGIADNAILLDGILETMTSKLSQIDNYKDALWVIPSSEVINENIKTPQEAYTLFGVNIVVTGSIQDILGKKRLTINLVDAENLRQLKSSVLDISGDNVINLQSELIIELIEMLDIKADEQIKGTLTEGITNDPMASSYYMNGQGYMYKYNQDNNLENAISLFKNAIQQDPEYALAYAALAEAYWRKYETLNLVSYVDSAKQYADKATAINKNLNEVKQTLGLLYLGTGEFEKARDAFIAILETEPRNDIAYSRLGEAYEAMTSYTEAEESFKKAIELQPGSWIAYKALGRFYLRTGKYEQAAQQLEKVVKLTPDNPQSYSNLGVNYYFMGEYEKAKQNFLKSMSLERTESAASNLGTIYYTQMDYEQAAKYYNIALEIQPNNYKVRGNLASVLGQMGNKEEERKNYLLAIESLRNQLQVNPNDANLNINIGTYFADIGDSLQAVPYINKALNLSGESPNIYFRAGSAYEILGNRSKALELLSLAVENDYPLANIINQPELADLIEDDDFQRLFKDKIKKQDN